MSEKVAYVERVKHFLHGIILWINIKKYIQWNREPPNFLKSVKNDMIETSSQTAILREASDVVWL